VLGKIGIDGGCRSEIERNTPQRMRSRVVFGEEILDGVEPGGRGRGEVREI
jgi:hypothetical protein